jgi:hypothetical protein
LYSCNREEQRAFSLSEPGKQIFEISNNGNKDAKFRMIINDVDLGSENNIVSYIREMDEQYPGESLEMKAFRFVRDNTWHDDLVTRNNWGYSPYVMINSFGGGLCGFRSATLTNLLLDLGFKAKSWCLNGHVVTEVFSGNKWILLDPDFGVYYYNEKNEIASYAEIVRNPSYITNPINPVITKENANFVKVYSGEMAELYYTVDDNEEFDTKYDESLKFDELWFSIPSNAKMTFPINKKFRGTYFAVAVLDLPAGYTGNLKMPLVIAGFDGNGIIKYQDAEHNTETFDALTCINSKQTVSWEIEIIENVNGLKVFYYINPLVYAAKEKNEILLKGYNLNGINIRFTENKEYALTLPYQQDLLYIKIDSIVREINIVAITEESKFNSSFAAEYFKLFVARCKEDSILKDKVDFEGFQFDCDSLVNVFAIDSLTDYSLYLQAEYSVPALRRMLKNRLKKDLIF